MLNKDTGSRNYNAPYLKQIEMDGRNLSSIGVRPVVDPHAKGEVDPSFYPNPREATNKIRGKSDFIEYFFGAVDQELLTAKTFYFFFYSAFGSLFPLMGVYFKQMGMNAFQCGLLIGLRPFIEFFSAPFWGSLADRWQKGKLILIASITFWIIFTLPLGFIQPPATSCINHTDYLGITNFHSKVKRSSDLSNFLNEDTNIRNDGQPALSKFDDSIKSFSNNLSKLKDMSHKDVAAYNSITTANKEKAASYLIRQKSSINVSEFGQSITNDFFKLNRHFYARYNNSISKTEHLNPFPLKKSRILTPLFNLTSIIHFLQSHLIIPEENKIPLMNGTFKNMINKKTITKIYETRNGLKTYSKNMHQLLQRMKRSIKFKSSANGSPMSVHFAANYDSKLHNGLVKPIYSSVVYRLSDIQKTFFLLLLLVIVGEFFSAPAITLADSAVITLLGEDADRYGHQRMFGSLGWGLAMFFVGIALDHSTSFPDHPCGPDIKEKNYTICFAIFSVLMGAALITATQINFKYSPVITEEPMSSLPPEPTKEEQLQSQLSQQLNLPKLQDSSLITSRNKDVVPEDKSKIFAHTTREIPEWVTVLKQFKDVKCASFLFVAWFMGFGIGLIFTFLFWHLQDYGGSPTLFGIASVINHVSEIFAYFFSFKLIRQIGHVKVLCLGLGGNVLRFLYISWLKNPWWVLPFEFMQGITHAAVWAACCSYIAHNTPLQLRNSAQGVLQGLHHGLGRGCGAVIGGIFVAYYGTTATFRAYGLTCVLVLAMFIVVNFYHKDVGFVSDLPQTEDPHQVAEVTHLAPHGVPSNAIPRALSSSRLQELINQDAGYGATYQTSNPNLNIPTNAEDNKNIFCNDK